MKKITLLTIASIAVMGLASCKKNYTCTCTTTYTGGSATSTITAKSTKSDAKAWCTAAQNASGGGSTSCSVK